MSNKSIYFVLKYIYYLKGDLLMKKQNGSYKKSGNNKSWRLTISLGYDENRKRIRKYKTVYCNTEDEVKRKLEEFYQGNTEILNIKRKKFIYMKDLLAEYCRNECNLYPQSKLICNKINCRAYHYVKFMTEKKGF